MQAPADGRSREIAPPFRAGYGSGRFATALCALALVAGSCGPAPATPGVSPGVSARSVATAATPTAALTQAPPSPAATVTPTAAPRLAISTLSIKLPKGISRAVAFVDGGSILLAGGLTASGTIGTVYRIGIADGSVQIDGRLAMAVHDAGGAVVGSTPTVFGGGNVAPERGVQQLGVPGRLVGELPSARADLVVVADGTGTAFVVGGGTPAHLERAVLSTTDGSHFRTIATLPYGVRYPAVAVVDGSILVAGGTDGVNDRSEIEAIDPATGSVRVVGRLPHGLAHATAFVVDGRLLIAGGRIAGVAQDTILEVDPASGTVTVAGHLPAPVSDAAGAVVDGVAYLVGGEDRDFVTSIVTIAFR